MMDRVAEAGALREAPVNSGLRTAVSPKAGSSPATQFEESGGPGHLPRGCLLACCNSSALEQTTRRLTARD